MTPGLSETHSIEFLDNGKFIRCFSDSDIRYGHKKVDKPLNKSIVSIEDFQFLKYISKGAFGRVWLVKRKATGDYYAMKIINMNE